MITKHEWRWVMGWADWLAVIINILTLLLLVLALFGCAAPERRAPIDYYREQYGFPT